MISSLISKQEPPPKKQWTLLSEDHGTQKEGVELQRVTGEVPEQPRPILNENEMPPLITQMASCRFWVKAVLCRRQSFTK